MQIPSSASIAVHTRTQQMHDRVEHQQLKKLVLDYEQREEEAERKSTLSHSSLFIMSSFSLASLIMSCHELLWLMQTCKPI